MVETFCFRRFHTVLYYPTDVGRRGSSRLKIGSDSGRRAIQPPPFSNWWPLRKCCEGFETAMPETGNVVPTTPMRSAAGKIRQEKPANRGAVDAVPVAGVLCCPTGPVRSDPGPFYAPSAAKLEGTAVVMTVITALAVIAVITGIPGFDRNEEGRTKERSCPKKPTPTGPHSSEGKSQGPEILE